MRTHTHIFINLMLSGISKDIDEKCKNLLLKFKNNYKNIAMTFIDLCVHYTHHSN